MGFPSHLAKIAQAEGAGWTGLDGLGVFGDPRVARKGGIFSKSRALFEDQLGLRNRSSLWVSQQADLLAPQAVHPMA